MKNAAQGTEVPEFIPSPPPVVELLRIAAPYTDRGTLGEARRLSAEELRLYLAYAEHERSTQQMREDMRTMLSNQPPIPKGNSESDNEQAQLRQEWQQSLDELVAAAIEEDRCFAGELDSEWGENITPKAHVLDWFAAPGGPWELEDMRRRAAKEGQA